MGGDQQAINCSKDTLQYNVGHIAAAEGDTVNPDGHYLVALNKWAVVALRQRAASPQNEQLLDIDNNAPKVVYDLPMGIAGSHYAQIIKADKLKAWDVYPKPVGTQLHRHTLLCNQSGRRKVVRMAIKWKLCVRSHFNPEHVAVKKGDHVIWHISSIETSIDATHGYTLGGYNVSLSIEPGETTTFEFDATQDGTFPFYCTEFCSALHLEMTGYLLVES